MTTRPQFKVFWSVVGSVSVLVVYSLFRKKRAIKDSFHNETVFLYPATVVSHDAITVIQRAFAVLVSAAATLVRFLRRVKRYASPNAVVVEGAIAFRGMLLSAAFETADPHRCETKSLRNGSVATPLW